MCIYFGNQPHLTYDKQEHVFSASFGGIDKFPNGVVSDQANLIFSKFEKEFADKTLVGFIRRLNIGKRGSLTRASRYLHQDFTNGDVYLSEFGKTLGISQLVITDDEAEIISRSEEEKDLFIKNLKTLSIDNRFIFKILGSCDKKTIKLVNLDDKWYIFHSFEINTDSYRLAIINALLDAIKQIYKEQDVMKKLPKKNKDTGYVGDVFKLDDLVNKFLIKTIINSMCYLFGEDKVNDRSLLQWKQYCVGIVNNVDCKFEFRISPSNCAEGLNPHVIKYYFDTYWKCEIAFFSEIYYTFLLPCDLSDVLLPNEIREYVVNWQIR